MYIISIALIAIIAIALFSILRVIKRLRHNIIHLKSLQYIDRSMLSGLSHKGIMNTIIERLNSALEIDAAAILVADHSTALKTIASSNLNKNFQKHMETKNSSFLSTVIENRKPVMIAKISSDEDEDFLRTVKKEGFVSYMGSPIMLKGGMPAGVLALYSQKPKRYTRQEISLIDTISSQIGIALDRAQLIERIQEMSLESVRALVEAIEIRDPYTRGHSVRVADLATIIAKTMELSKREIKLVKFAGLLHDVGKLVVPENVLQKTTKLTDKEWKIIKKHTVHSAKIIEPIRNLRSIKSWVLHHHERWDGNGYPDHRKGKHIPLQSRILAVCDTYSAMTGDRPYRKAISEKDTIKEIEKVAGTQLDPEIVDLFLNLHSKGFSISSK